MFCLINLPRVDTNRTKPRLPQSEVTFAGYAWSLEYHCVFIGIDFFPSSEEIPGESIAETKREILASAAGIPEESISDSEYYPSG